LRNRIFGFVFVGTLVFASCNPSEKTAESAANSDMSNLEKEHLLVRAGYADSVNQGLLEDTIKGSSRREAKGSIGNTEVTINYGSPGVRGRVIWNGLVSYDQVWVSGSHWATAVTFSNDVVIAGTEVPAGMYGFFTILGKETWTLILNKNFDMHLADDYEEAQDVVKVIVTPEVLENPVQRLTYEVSSDSESTGAVSMSWDQIRVRMPITLK
jgi:hypothetical protein